MCGIIGYLGKREASHVLLDGLKRLEYRGYDSAGVAILNGSGIQIQRAQGKISVLENKLLQNPIQGDVGIGHTRWATHGIPAERNAHPHRVDDIVVVHNGIIENYGELRRELMTSGCQFNSETDTEVFCHLVNREIKKTGNTFSALQRALTHVRGSYALVVLNQRDRDNLYLARLVSPLVVGQGEGENFVASDISALLPYTRKVVYFEDGEIGILNRKTLQVFNGDGTAIQKVSQQINWDTKMAEKEGYKHFMLKEIFEQPRVIEDTLMGRLDPYSKEVILDEVAGLLDGGRFPFSDIKIVAFGAFPQSGAMAEELVVIFCP